MATVKRTKRTKSSAPACPIGPRKSRPRPTAYLTDSPYPAVGCEDRRIILSTGRGCVRIDPKEAAALIQELKAAAVEMRRESRKR